MVFLVFSNVPGRKSDDKNTPWNSAIDLHRGPVVIEHIPHHEFMTGSAIMDKHGHEVENMRIVLRLGPSVHLKWVCIKIIETFLLYFCGQ